MEQQNQIDKQELLKQLYGTFALYKMRGSDTPNPKGDLSLADVDHKKFGEARQIFDGISDIVNEFGGINECYGRIDGDAIFYSRINGTLYCKRMVGNEKCSPQELYEREDILDDYRLHIFTAERGRSAIGSSIEMVVGITDKKGVPVYTGSFEYETINRLINDPLVYHISKKLKRELASYFQSHTNISIEELKRVTDNLVLSLLDKPELLKNMKLRFESRHPNKPV